MEKLIQMIQDTLYINDVTSDSKLTELGGDSLSITSLLIDVEVEFDVEIGFDDLLKDQTISELWKTIEEKRQ